MAFTLELAQTDGAVARPGGVAVAQLHFAADRCGGNFSRIKLDFGGEVRAAPRARACACVHHGRARRRSATSRCCSSGLVSRVARCSTPSWRQGAGREEAFYLPDEARKAWIATAQSADPEIRPYFLQQATPRYSHVAKRYPGDPVLLFAAGARRPRA